jgi:hypothetical protein
MIFELLSIMVSWYHGIIVVNYYSN